MKVIGYARVSTRGQAENGLSLDTQRERITAWATAHGHTLLCIDADEGVSGSTDPEKRPELSKALAELKNGNADALVFTDLSRATRSMKHLAELNESYTLVSLSENLDTTTLTGKLVMNVIGSVNEWMRENIAEKTKETLAHRKEQGRHISRFTPWGWRFADGNFDASKVSKEVRGEALVEHDQERVDRSAARVSKECGVGLEAVAAGLDINPRSKRPYTRENVRSMLRRR